MDEVTVTRSEERPVVRYKVVLRGDGEPEHVEADHVSLGTHWIEFFIGGERTGVFPATSIGFIRPDPLDTNKET